MAVATEKTVFQVSDRRITSFADQSIRPDQNKSVLVDGEVAFGFSGPSLVCGEPTAEWLAKAIANIQPREDWNAVCQALQESLTLATSRMNMPWPNRRMAIQGIGWFNNGTGALRPATLTIENALNDSGEWLADARSRFRYYLLPFLELRQGLEVRSIGAAIRPEEKSEVVTALRELIGNSNTHDLDIVSGLVRAMQWLSLERGHSTVGASGYVMAIPRPSVGAAGSGRAHRIIMAGSPEPSAPTFLYFNESGEIELRGPHFVLGDAVLSDFKGGYTV